MQIVPLKQEHLDKVRMQGGQEYASQLLTPEAKAALEGGMSFSVIDGDEVLGCGGVVEYWDGRAAVWALLSGNCGRRFTAIHRAVATFFDLKRYRRLEATTATEFEAGHRWLKMLGFKMETERMRGYLPNGADASMYVRGI